MAYFSHGYLCRSVTNSPDGRREIAFAISLRRCRLRSGMEISMKDFLRLLKDTAVFLLAAQMLMHFLPAKNVSEVNPFNPLLKKASAVNPFNPINPLLKKLSAVNPLNPLLKKYQQ